MKYEGIALINFTTSEVYNVKYCLTQELSIRNERVVILIH